MVCFKRIARVCAALGLALGSTIASQAQGALAHEAPAFRGLPGSTWFGWDVFEADKPHSSFFGFSLDDATPDLGAAAGAHVQQNNQIYGNVSGTNNIYSGFFPNAVLDVTITTPTDGVVGNDGFTTVVLQITGNPSSADALASILLDGVAPDDLVAAINPLNMDKAQWWAQWTVPGNAAAYDLTIVSVGPHMSIDGFTVDTVYSAADPIHATPIAIVPAPGAATGLIGLGLVHLSRRRKLSLAGGA